MTRTRASSKPPHRPSEVPTTYPSLAARWYLRDDRDCLLYMYPTSRLEWFDLDEPLTAAGEFNIPDLSTMSGWMVECRWNDLLADLVAVIAVELDQPAWVLDGKNMLWRCGLVFSADHGPAARRSQQSSTTRSRSTRSVMSSARSSAYPVLPPCWRWAERFSGGA